MPLPRFALHAAGEQIHVAAWPEVPDIHQLASRHYAFEGRCFVVLAGQLLHAADIPTDFEMPGAIDGLGDFGGGHDVILPGGSGVIGPDRRWIVGPIGSEPTTAYADVDLDRILEEQLALDTAGHYQRPDVFSVGVDRRRRTPFSDT